MNFFIDSVSRLFDLETESSAILLLLLYQYYPPVLLTDCTGTWTYYVWESRENQF